jgi:hypothetical protein
MYVTTTQTQKLQLSYKQRYKTETGQAVKNHFSKTRNSSYFGIGYWILKGLLRHGREFGKLIGSGG